MANLRERVELYTSERNRFVSLEQEILAKIRTAFDAEIPALNSRLPVGRTIREYNIVPPETFSTGRPSDKPAIIIPVYDPVTDSGVFSHLNKLLAEEYKRFEEQCGVNVMGFVETHAMG